jgi:hypothetical protein
MLTYQLQSRVYRINDGDVLFFPNDVEIEILLEPPEPFGAATCPSRTAVKGHKANVRYDANTGRGTIQSDPPLLPIEVILEYTNLRFEIRGNKMLVQTMCDSARDLDELLTSLHYTFPILLNVDFADPPTVKHTSGRVGATPFRWELKEAIHSFDITTQERQEERIVAAFERLQLIQGMSNRRLAAALHYFHVSCRLIAAGNSPWEFMAESVLNLSKVIEILFGPQRDVIRTELAKLGYSEEEIEGDFIPITILRNEFDVGHVTISLLKPEQLKALYGYLERTELNFRNLMRCLLDKVRDGAYELPQDYDLTLDRDKRNIMNRLIRTFEERRRQNST